MGGGGKGGGVLYCQGRDSVCQRVSTKITAALRGGRVNLHFAWE